MLTRDLAVSTLNIMSPSFPRSFPHARHCAKYMTCLVSVIWGLSLLLFHVTEETPETRSHLPAAAQDVRWSGRLTPSSEFVTPFRCNFPEARRDTSGSLVLGWLLRRAFSSQDHIHHVPKFETVLAFINQPESRPSAQETSH